MTTLTSADGPSEVITARRTESLDAPSILRLSNSTTEQLFGRVNVVNLIEKAVLAVTLSNDRDEVLGHAAFFDYPNVPGVPQSAWEEWLNKYYDTKKCNAMNTLFMHFFVARPEYSHGCAKEIIRTMFNAVPDLHYCYLIVPTGVYPDSALTEVFTMLPKIDDKVSPDGCVIFGCYRYNHVPVLHIRQARVEDTDDLVPIFNKQSDLLKSAYGDFFLAELIEAEDDEMKCIVGEVDGTAVGFMSVSDELNIELLNECYELGPFHGLRKEHPDDITVAPGTPQPTPPPEERPPSAKSDHSHKSTASHSSKKSSTSTSADKPASSNGEKTMLGSRSSSKGSIKAEDIKAKSKLSDTMLGGSQSSLLSDHSDAESVKSAAEERQMSAGQGSRQRTETQAPGTAGTVPVTPKPPTPRAQLPKRFVPTYYGASNTVCIQLFCIDERYEMRSADFLAKVFELFPEREYCIITVPHLVPEFPLLQQFVRVTPRVPSTLAQELYVFSRAGLLRNFSVRLACTSDNPGIEKLVNTLDLHENLLNDLTQFNKARRDNDGTEIQSFVAECNKQIVGIAVVRREEDIEYIRSHYNIEDFIYYNHHRRDEHGHLHHYALNPIFKHYSKHFLKEILRLGHKTCLYYPLFPPYADKDTLEKHTLVGALPEMVPVRARRQIDYPTDKLRGNAPSERVLKQTDNYALNHINRKLTLEPKVTINARIVVVGASDVGLSFLETFAFCPHLRFNNLSLISPHGLPGELPPDELRDQTMGTSHCYSQTEYAQMALRSWVNVVYGKMTGIDRKKKHVIVNNNRIVPYDHLVIATGMQYQVPMPTGADVSKLVTSQEAPNSPDKRFVGELPKNLFIINDQYDAAVSLYWVENNILNNKGKAVVYGNDLDAYCCIQSLISMGISGERIVLVEPPLNYKTTCFNNPDIEAAIAAALKEQGVEVYSGYLLAEFNDGMDSNELFSVAFTSRTLPVRIECQAMFAFYKRMVDSEAFNAINDACLVFDGRLVIDANFHTNDVSIRAAGPVTKFQRSYHADEWSHSNFNSKEIGIQLASTMLTLFDPTLEPEPEPPQDLLKLIPMYRSPKVQGGILPGGYHYLHVAKPNLNTPLEILKAQTDYGKEVITGKPGETPDYFRLHLNQYDSIETITCLSKKPFPASNIMCLYGLHERYLNSLVSRFNEGLIKDLFEYFQETWCLAIFHDRFPDFRDEIRELLITRPSADIEALEEKVRKMVEDDLHLNKSQRKNLADDYSDLGFKRAVETRLLSFLSYNYYHLPMYAKPGMV